MLAARKVVGQQALKMRVNVQGTLEDLDPEYLHDLRVATRRLRSALRLFAELRCTPDEGLAIRRLLARNAKALLPEPLLVSRADSSNRVPERAPIDRVQDILLCFFDTPFKLGALRLRYQLLR